jgi:hypothetical protein
MYFVYLAIIIAGFAILVKTKLVKLEYFTPDTRVDQPCPPGYAKCPSGDCKLKTDVYGQC